MEVEKVVETKICKHCNSSFCITDKDLEFYEKISPSFKTPPNLPLSGEGFILPPDKGDGGGYKYLIPTPQLCLDCRQQRRLSFRNERKLYHRKCDLTGKQIISIYSPDKPYKVYDQEEWWSDKWTPLDYGKDFDFSKSFFVQFDELMKEVPFISLHNTTNENSEYINLSGYNKDCYLVFAGEYNDKCMYSSRIIECNNCIDNIEITKSDNCYENINVENSYDLFFSQNCKSCNNSYFLYSCIGCNNCIGCTNLINKSYYIYNKEYSKEEYIEIKNKLFLSIINGDIEENFKYFNSLKINNSIHKGENIINCENCIGDNIFESKNITFGFDCTELEDSKYIYSGSKGKDLFDVSNTTEQNISYESLSVGYKSYGLFFTNGGWTCNNIFYSFHCHNSSNLFGCIGVRSKEYCILNKQYTKEEYEELVPRIIEHMQKTGEWGEFFPSSISPFGYNETVAEEYFPIGKEEVLKKGFKRSDYEKQNGYDGEFYKPLEIKQYDEKVVGKELASKNIEELLKGILQCEITKKPFRIIKQELDFYIKHNLPIPKKHPDQRHLDRMNLRNPRKLYDRKCDKCGKDIKTTYSPDRFEIVYCEECYKKEVY